MENQFQVQICGLIIGPVSKKKPQAQVKQQKPNNVPLNLAQIAQRLQITPTILSKRKTNKPQWRPQKRIPFNSKL